MNRKNIHKFSPAFLLFLLIGSIYQRLYYRKFNVIGRENIPKNSPLLFAPNHQNAFMDPVAIIYSTRRQVVFFARADIFRKKIIARILYFFKILPIYRIRDGFRSVDQNRDMFKEAIKVLDQKRAVAMHPEGNHVARKHLRPLRKGAARLALMAEAESNFQLGLQLVPVGIDYSNYFNAGSDLLVIFGTPISINNYKEQYLDNPPKAITLLTDDLAKALRGVMIDIKSEIDYDCMHLAMEVYSNSLPQSQNHHTGLYENFQVRKKLTDELNVHFKHGSDVTKELRLLTSEFADKLRQYRLHLKIIKKKPSRLFKILSEIICMVILFPLHLYGMIWNYIPYKLPSYISRNVKDRPLKVSVRFGSGFILFVTYYLILAIGACLVPVALPIKAFFLLSVPLAGVFSLYYYRNILKMIGKWRWLRLMKKNKKEYEQVVSTRNRIIEILTDIMK